MSRGGWVLAGIASGLVAITVAAGALAWKPALPPVPPPAAAGFDRATVLRGQTLVHLGNCSTCHTAPGGRGFAGGKALRTPFGTIFASNITPDPETGIGRWSSEAFTRAMRDGVSRDGSLLYPAFPYDHFTHTSDSDLDALYAFFMTRPPVRTQIPDNRLAWPFGYRPLLVAWNLLYLKKDAINEADRGRYLAEGLAHCGACHTPRDRWGAEMSDRAYDGAWTEGWYAPALNARSPAVQPWTADELFEYLRTGRGAMHAAAAGPMSEVTRELASAAEADVRALAGYFAGLMADAPAAKGDLARRDNESLADRTHPEGGILFAGACAACHDAGAPMMQQGRPPLAWGTPLHEDTPHDTLQVIIQGLGASASGVGPSMPAFGNDFTDRQLAEVAAYLRTRYTDLPPWQNLEQAVSDVRKAGGR
ncbi:cytochrome c [Reyranella sp.]|uniref:c-type cytochrome n=1 Tax=Reyranella sp. TaxID=1929291 RepID=UPI002F935F02